MRRVLHIFICLVFILSSSGFQQLSANASTFSTTYKNDQINQTNSSINNKRVALIMNSSGEGIMLHAEEGSKIDKYLSDLGLTLDNVYGYDVAYENIKDYDLVIFDDMGYTRGISPGLIECLVKFHESKKPLYFIGDDLANNAFGEKTSDWYNLIGLEEADNGMDSMSSFVTPTAGMSNVSKFIYHNDLDKTYGKSYTNVLLKNNSFDAMVSYEDGYGKVASQLPCVYASNRVISDDSGIKQLEIVFKTTINWLMGLQYIEPAKSLIGDRFVFVADKSGQPIPGAKVEIAEQIYSTDNKGYADLNGVPDGQQTLVVTKEGYNTYEGVFDAFDTVFLEPSTNRPYIKSAFVFFKHKDVRIFPLKLGLIEYKIDSTKNTRFDFEILFNWGESTPGKVYLQQGAIRVPADSNSSNLINGVAKFNNIDLGSTFKEKRGPIYIVLVPGSRNENKVVFDTKLGIMAYDSSIFTDLSLPKMKDEVVVPKHVFGVGGDALKVSLGSVPFEIERDFEKKTFKAILGFNRVDTSSDGDKVNKPSKLFSDIRESLNKARSKDNDIYKNTNALFDMYKNKTNTGFLNKSGVANIFPSKGLTIDYLGYLEGELDEKGIPSRVKEGGIILRMNKVLGWEYQFIVFSVPAYAAIGFDFANIEGSLGINGGTLINPQFTSKIELKPNVDIGGGVGLVKVITLGIHGKLELQVELSDPMPEKPVKLESGFYALFKFLGGIYEKTWPFEKYPDDKKPSLNKTGLESDSPYNQNSYTLSSRDYLKKSSQWLGTSKTVKPYGYNPGDSTVLQTNLFPEAKPLLIQNGEQKMLLWTADDISRSAIDRTKLVYSIYDKNTSTWSFPLSVANDGTGDFYPSVAKGDNIFTAWQNAGKVYTDPNTPVETITSGSEIMVSKYDSVKNTWSAPARITNNNLLDHSPVVTSYGNKAAVVWMQNTGNDMFGLQGNNNLMYSLYDGNTWSEPKIVKENVGKIISWSAAQNENGTYITYNIDEDEKLETMTDREIYLAKINTTGVSITRITNDSKMDSSPKTVRIGETVKTYWYQEGNIAYMDDVTKPSQISYMFEAAKPGLTDDFNVIEGNGTSGLIWTQDAGNGNVEVYAALYDNEKSRWYSSDKITNTNARVKYPQGIIKSDGTIQLAFNRAAKQAVPIDGTENFYYKDGQSDLCVSDITLTHNIGLDSVMFDDTQYNPGSQMDLYLNITNKDNLPVDRIKTEVYEGDPSQGGALNISQITEQVIQPGETKTIDVQVNSTHTMLGKDIFVKISPINGQDVDETDNVKSVKIGFTDISIDGLKLEDVGSRRVLSGTVKNNSAVKAENVNLKIRLGAEDGIILSNHDIGTLEPNGTKNFVYESDANSTVFTDGLQRLYIQLATSSVESNTSNNTEYAVFYDPSSKPVFDINVLTTETVDTEINADVVITNNQPKANSGIIAIKACRTGTDEVLGIKVKNIDLEPQSSEVVSEVFEGLEDLDNIYIKAELLQADSILINGIEDKGVYNTDRTITFNIGSATLNGEPFNSGDTVTVEGDYTLIVTAGEGISRTITFTIDRTVPIVTVPENNAKNVRVDKRIMVIFNESLEQGTKFEEIVLKDRNGAAIEAVTKIDGKVLVIDPKDDLSYSTSYNVTIPASSLRYLNGNEIYKDYTLSFVTELEPLKVISSNPSQDGTMDVATELPITLTFNKDISSVVTVDKKGKNSGVTLKDDSGNEVYISYSLIDNRLIVNLLGNLNYNTKYELTIPQNAIWGTDNTRLRENYVLRVTTKEANVFIIFVDNIAQEVIQGDSYVLQSTVKAYLSNGSMREMPVSWNAQSVDTSKAGTYVYEGTIEGYSDKVTLKLTVKPKKEINVPNPKTPGKKEEINMPIQNIPGKIR